MTLNFPNCSKFSSVYAFPDNRSKANRPSFLKCFSLLILTERNYACNFPISWIEPQIWEFWKDKTIASTISLATTFKARMKSVWSWRHQYATISIYSVPHPEWLYFYLPSLHNLSSLISSGQSQHFQHFSLQCKNVEPLSCNTTAVLLQDYDISITAINDTWNLPTPSLNYFCICLSQLQNPSELSIINLPMHPTS